ncbi:MAG: DUF4198 domain-containing protein [Planctomycetia bacterium]|nr:DUF4198 domain-containing protein [Planctomycetia bacterium]
MKAHLFRAATMAVACAAAVVQAHDTWVQTATTVARTHDVVHVDLVLGNHGNDHRDFKIAGKLGSLDGTTLAVLGPDGTTTDLVPALVDLGFAPKEGYWSARFVAADEGLHCVAHARSGIRHGGRGFKGGKTWFLAAHAVDAPPQPTAEFTTPLGHPLELVPETHPVLGTGPGKPIALRLLFKGKPLADHRVSFIPRGATLDEGFDPNYERMTDTEGRCHYTPTEGTFILVVAHLVKPDEKGEGYDKTSYAATLVLNVPERCDCCD